MWGVQFSSWSHMGGSIFEIPHVGGGGAYISPWAVRLRMMRSGGIYSNIASNRNGGCIFIEWINQVLRFVYFVSY